jgi:hypothetical protein
MKTGELLAVTGEIVDSLQSTVMLYLIESSLPDLKAYAELKHGESCSLSISSWRPKGGGSPTVTFSWRFGGRLRGPWKLGLSAPFFRASRCVLFCLFLIHFITCLPKTKGLPLAPSDRQVG